MNPWLWLALAIICEIFFSISAKYAAGFSKLVPSVICTISTLSGTYCLSAATKTLPIGTAYMIWTGVGSVATVLLGILLFKESATAVRIFWIALIIVGLVGLKLSSHEG